MKCNFNPYEGNENYIFISYSHKDNIRVSRILEELNAKGFRIWYDEGIEWGSEWPESIAFHLKNCEVCVAFHSHTSSISSNCRQEINYALKKRKKILSVYLEEVELSDGMDMQLSSYQSTFLFQYNNFNDFLNKLVETSMLQCCRNVYKTEKPIIENKKNSITRELRAVLYDEYGAELINQFGEVISEWYSMLETPKMGQRYIKYINNEGNAGYIDILTGKEILDYSYIDLQNHSIKNNDNKLMYSITMKNNKEKINVNVDEIYWLKNQSITNEYDICRYINNILVIKNKKTDQYCIVTRKGKFKFEYDDIGYEVRGIIDYFGRHCYMLDCYLNGKIGKLVVNNEKVYEIIPPIYDNLELDLNNMMLKRYSTEKNMSSKIKSLSNKFKVITLISNWVNV